MIDRREFLRFGTGAALGLNALPGVAQSSSQENRIRRYVPLGRTGLNISDISFGSASSSDPLLVRHALERGVNYFDTAESYRWGNAEEAIGQALRGRRDKIILATKTKAGASDTREQIMRALEGSLRRLQTDHVDVYFNHAVNDVSRLQNDAWLETTELAKRQGKIRFRGMSGHGSHLVECLDYALDQNLVDVILAAHNFGQDPSFYDKLRHTFHWAAIQTDLPRVLNKAKEKNVGVIAMKTLMGARLNDMRPYEKPGFTFAQAALRWVLSNPHVDALIISMTSTELIDEYLGASGEVKLSEGELQLLARYAEMQSASYCRPGCKECEHACPESVPIAEVLRTRMYAVDYRDRALARAEYAELGTRAASPCIGCAHQACLNACPYGIPIAKFTLDAALRLT
jgi:uncharacterized protein